MKPTLARQYFACTRLRAKLTRASCAHAHKLANQRSPGAGRVAVVVSSLERCKQCPVGADHERGRAVVPPVTLVQVRVDKPEQPRRCLACGMVLERERWRANYCDIGCKLVGRRLRAMELSAEVGL